MITLSRLISLITGSFNCQSDLNTSKDIISNRWKGRYAIESQPSWTKNVKYSSELFCIEISIHNNYHHFHGLTHAQWFFFLNRASWSLIERCISWNDSLSSLKGKNSLNFVFYKDLKRMKIYFYHREWNKDYRFLI